MTTTLHTDHERLKMLAQVAAALPSEAKYTLKRDDLRALVLDANAARSLHELVNTPHTADFLEAVRLEAAHQVDRWGDAHDRGKSGENWFWLVGYLAGKCLRGVVEGDKQKALHHAISSAAALLNWHKAILKDTTGRGLGADNDIRPVEIARFEGSTDSLETSEAEALQLPAISLPVDLYSGR